jgi:hypothetical protein
MAQAIFSIAMSVRRSGTNINWQVEATGGGRIQVVAELQGNQLINEEHYSTAFSKSGTTQVQSPNALVWFQATVYDWAQGWPGTPQNPGVSVNGQMQPNETEARVANRK